MKKLLTLAAATIFVVALAAPVLAADNTSSDTETKVEQKDNGGYKAETTTKSDDAAGTTVKSDKSQELDVDSNGNSEKTTTSEKSTDPKGLFNKKTNKTKDVVKKKNGKVTHKHKTTVNGTTTEDSESTTAPAK